MIRNYLAASWRNLIRNRLYAGLTIVGLALGFAAAILVSLYVRDELTFDRFIPGGERVYSVAELIQPSTQAPFTTGNTEVWEAPLMRTEFPQIEEVTRLTRAIFPPSVKRGVIQTAEQTFLWADPNFFKVLPLPVVAGDLSTALAAPDGLVISRAKARKYFGRDAPIGQTLLVDGHPMRVTAVIQDLPSNTHLVADFFGSSLAAFGTMKQWEELNRPGSASFTVWTYVRLRPGADAKALEKALPAFQLARMPMQPAILKQIGNWRVTPSLVPLHEMHMLQLGGALKPKGDIQVISAIGTVGALIVFIAAINFVTMMTARASRRAVEVGVRKSAGASRRDLIIQFLGEALIYVVLSMIVAMALAELLLPVANAMLQKRMTFAYLSEPLLAAGIVAATLIVGLLAGAYPALVLSSFSPATVLKGGLSSRGGVSGRVRQVLVTLQFAVLIGLIVMSATIARQTLFAINEGMRVNKDQVMLAFAQPCSDSLRNQVRALPGVKTAACSSSFAIGMSSTLDNLTVGGRAADVSSNLIDFGFFDVYGVRPLAGRLFEENRTQDDLQLDPDAITSIVLNETAAHKLGFASASAAIGQSVGWHGAPRPDINAPLTKRSAQIIGVVPDFTFTNLRVPIQPIFFYIGPKTPLYSVALNVKVEKGRTQEVGAAIDRIWARIGDNKPMIRVGVDQFMLLQYADTLTQGALMAACAGLALFIGCLGLFAMSVYTAEQRTKEIGVRKAMGASARDILRLLLWQFSKPVLWANLIAWPTAWFLMDRWLKGFAYHIDLGPGVFLAASGAALLIAWLTVLAQSVRVARAKPVSALRYE